MQGNFLSKKKCGKQEKVKEVKANKVNISNLAEGIYFVKITVQNKKTITKTITKTIIKQ